jgi:hypothetical protein
MRLHRPTIGMHRRCLAGCGPCGPQSSRDGYGSRKAASLLRSTAPIMTHHEGDPSSDCVLREFPDNLNEPTLTSTGARIVCNWPPARMYTCNSAAWRWRSTASTSIAKCYRLRRASSRTHGWTPASKHSVPRAACSRATSRWIRRCSAISLLPSRPAAR